MSELLREMREKAHALASGLYEKHQVWAQDMGNTAWYVHPETYGDMWTTNSTDIDVPLPSSSTHGIINWLGIPLERDHDIPRGEIELRWAIRSGS